MLLDITMAKEHARLIADRIVEGKEPTHFVDPKITAPSKTYTRTTATDDMQKQSSSSSSYVLAEDHSQFSRDIQHWMNGSQVPTPMPATPTTATTDNIGAQGERPAVVQRSTLAHSYSLETYSGIWYVLAMFLPIFSLNGCPTWRCTPSLVLNSAELLVTQVSRLCGHVRAQLRQISQDQVAREIFATIMDVVLVIYAVGFLVLSMYQASLFV